MSAGTSTEVLIVGGGPVGLSLAIELGLRGISTVLVEKHVRPSAQPRAKTTNVRSMEHFRRWGVAEAIRAASPLDADYPTDVVFSTRLLGRHLVTIDNAFCGARVRDERYSEPAQWIPQYLVEDVLRERAAGLPAVTLHSGAEFIDVVDNGSGVEAEIAVAGRTERIGAQYLVGADGARSTVRDKIGAQMQGRHAYAANYNLVLRIPELRDHPPAQRAIMYWLINPESPAVMGPMDKDDVWFFGLQLPPGVTQLSPEEITGRVHAAIGRDMAFEIMKVDLWAAHQLVADRYRKGRVFLAGDACHLHPPFGGYGMNLGVADAVDLGWKLAARLQGWGGEDLLASYELERKPVHERTIGEAVENYRVLSVDLIRDGLEDNSPAGEAARAAAAAEIMDSKRREFKTLGVVLGSQYSGSPIVVTDGSMAPEQHYDDYRPSAHPGCLAPHLWLADGTSLYDHFGPGFTLIAMGADEAAVAQFRAAAAGNDVPLAVVRLAEPRARELYEANLALIRPDQYVAWRGYHVQAEEAEAALAQACGKRLPTPAAQVRRSEGVTLPA